MKFRSVFSGRKARRAFVSLDEARRWFREAQDWRGPYTGLFFVRKGRLDAY
jgi:hypothetical protein